MGVRRHLLRARVFWVDGQRLPRQLEHCLPLGAQAGLFQRFREVGHQGRTQTIAEVVDPVVQLGGQVRLVAGQQGVPLGHLRLELWDGAVVHVDPGLRLGEPDVQRVVVTDDRDPLPAQLTECLAEQRAGVVRRAVWPEQGRQPAARDEGTPFDDQVRGEAEELGGAGADDPLGGVNATVAQSV